MSVRADNFSLVLQVPQKVQEETGKTIQRYLWNDGDADIGYKRIPCPTKWGEDLLAVEIFGDSMTAIHLFDGDLAFYRPGEVRGDGIYAIQVDGEILVKRLEFDHLRKKLIIRSENPKYSTRVEPSDSQKVTILGKVRGWMHGHPY